MAVSAPINMETFQDAVHEWFADATGLETVWRDQSAPQPEYPYGSLKIIAGPIPASPWWDEVSSTNLSRPAGQEVQLTYQVPCSMTVSCQAYVGMDDARNPNKDAISYMTRAQSSLAMSSVRSVLRASNIAVINPGSVQEINEVIEDAFVSRANLDVSFGASLELNDFVGYIAQVRITTPPPPDGLDFTMLIDAS